LVKRLLKPKEHGIVVVIADSDRKRNSRRWRMRWTLWLTKTPRKPVFLAYLAFLVFLLVEVCLAWDLLFHLPLSPVLVLVRVLLHLLYHSRCLVLMGAYRRHLCQAWTPTTLRILLNYWNL
jgi:hypothetical protein